ncbi:tRNA (guanine(37)-N1)-methyltransferase [Thoreauomyces humboldtii]|nr:tRNA (guanine(37)-N1)-methyltransferase [Thoreauomyces humboldtii]
MTTVLSPPANKGLAKLNRALFQRTLNLVALRVPAASCARAMKELAPSGLILNYPRQRGIVEDPTDNLEGAAEKTARRLVLLNTSITETTDPLPTLVKDFVEREGGEVTKYALTVGYEYWTADQVLRSILPDDIDVPGAFEAVGHIAHVNLRDQYLPYKHIIGEVLLDKNPNLRTIVNKTGNIDHTFRFFQMELLCGDNDMMAEVHESGCRFRFDFSRVYWNSRLQTEHDRIVKSFGKNQLVCDVFGGVGPYAIPAAKNRGCVVFANDLNPASHEFLCENININKVGHLVQPFNTDGRDFIKESLKLLNAGQILNKLRSNVPMAKTVRGNRTSNGAVGLSAPSVPSMGTAIAPLPVALQVKGGFRWFDQYVMNLPDTAIEFLDAFRGLLEGHEAEVPLDRLPMIHCHCFSNKEDATEDVIKRVEAVIGARIGDNLVKVHNVRNVAPSKEMLCISFRLPADVAFAATVPPIR